MKVLVTGGRGTLGRLLTPRLGAAGHEVVITSRSEKTPADGTEARVLDLTDHPTPQSALEGIDTVVHTASNAARPKSVDVAGTARLLEAAQQSNVGHVVYISIVGVDEHPFPYYRAKLEAEGLVADSSVPDSILRATQFHEFLDRILASGGPVIPVFNGFAFQVIDGGTVADRLVELVDAGPQGRVADVGGPRSEPMHDMAHSWKTATGSGMMILPIPAFGRSAQAFRAKAHHTQNRLAGTPTWDDWLAAKYRS